MTVDRALARTMKRRRRKAQSQPEGRRVYARYWPERHGTVIPGGYGEQIEVKWDDGSTADRYVPHYKLMDVKDV